jgi:hypothetical protein
VPGAPPLRLAFVGRRAIFGSCALEDAVAGVEPAFFDAAPGDAADAAAAALRAFAPDAVVVFAPEDVPAGVLDGVDVPLIELGHGDPLPVSDRMYAAVGGDGAGARVLFVGRSTAYREQVLIPLKHDFDVLHVAHGVTGERLRGYLAGADIALNVHTEPGAAFEHRVALSLAAGLLVLSEPLAPAYGLIAGVDYVEAREPWEMWELVTRIRRTPHAFRAMRLSGRRQAERFRASRVYPRLAREAIAGV